MQATAAWGKSGMRPGLLPFAIFEGKNAVWEIRHDHDIILGPACEICEAAVPHRAPQVSAAQNDKTKRCEIL